MFSPRLSLADRALQRLLRRLVRTPRLDAVYGDVPVNDRGDRFDAELHRLSRIAAAEAKLSGEPLESRETMRRGMLLAGSDAVDLFRVERRVVGTVPAILYQPRPVPAGPVIYYIHGGGWTGGGDDAYDRVMRQLAYQTSLSVLSLQYPLAPEHPFPEALDALVAGWPRLAECAPRWGATSDAIILAGDSAGGNLALALTLEARERGYQLPRHLGLIYPAVDLRRQTPSHPAFGRGFFLDKPAMDAHLAAYAADPLDPRASVLLAESLSDLPRTTVVTAGFDPLRDEGEQLVDRLREAGNDVHHLAYPTLPHGFLHMDGVSTTAAAALRETVLYLAHGC